MCRRAKCARISLHCIFHVLFIYLFIYFGKYSFFYIIFKCKNKYYIKIDKLMVIYLVGTSVENIDIC